MARRIAIIDADTVLYANCANAEAKLDDNTFVPLLPLDKVILNIMGELENMADAIQADDVYIVLSDDLNWRKRLYPPYKANRKDMRKPALLAEVKRTIRASADAGKLPHTVMVIKHLEADDVCGISSGALAKQNREPVIISSDKDLRTVPGLLWNPRPSSSGRKREIEHISEAEADHEHMMQTLTGDNVDGYPGCPDIGPVRALTILQQYSEALPWERWRGVVEAFEAKGLTEDDAIMQARMARILRLEDWDAVNKKVRLWQPPREEG